MSINFYNAGMNAFEAGDYKEAYDYLIQDDQDPRCAFALGVLFYNGQGVERNFKRSTHYYTVAAEAVSFRHRSAPVSPTPMQWAYLKILIKPLNT